MSDYVRIFRGAFAVDYIPVLLDSQRMTKVQDAALAEAFAAQLRHLRKEVGLSQEQLAHRAGVDRTFVGKLEQGKHQPSLAVVFALAHAVDKTPEDLIALVRQRISAVNNITQTKAE